MKQLLTLFAVLFSATINAQNVGIGTTTPNNSAMLEINATNKGLRLGSCLTKRKTKN